MTTQQENKQYEYFAFISYKREDEKWAKWLQKKLEYYRLPSSVRKNNPNLPEKIRPVFKDTTDLESGVLTQKIQDALSSSKFLIVICSPRSANSVWVSKEVRSFIDSGRADCIIPFIIGGTPNAINPENECFPEGLRQLADDEELLGVNINEMGRDAATVKVIAHMFDIRFDILWQRYQRIVRKRNINILLGIGALLAVAIAAAVMFWNKNEQIALQNQRLNTLLKNQQEENITFSQQHDREERYTYVGSLRGYDIDYGESYRTFHPFEPIIAFSDNWGFWIHHIKSNSEILLPTVGDEYAIVNIIGLEYSRKGDALIGTASFFTHIWDVNTNKIVKHYCTSEMASFPDEYLRNENVLYGKITIDSLNRVSAQRYSWNGATIFAEADSAHISEQIWDDGTSELEVVYNRRHQEVLFLGNKRYALYDEKANRFVQFFKGYNTASVTLNPSGEYMLIGNDIFERNSPIDTIKGLSFNDAAISEWPNFQNKAIKVSNKKWLKIYDNTISYSTNGLVKTIKVLKNITSGNGQEYLSDAVFIEPNKIGAIVCQGKHRIYNAFTGDLLGTFESNVWSENNLGHEDELSHAESYIAYTKSIGRNLYVVSSGGIIRIYNVDRLRLERVIELPFKRYDDLRTGNIEKCYISDDGTRIYYYFNGYPVYYECELPVG